MPTDFARFMSGESERPLPADIRRDINEPGERWTSLSADFRREMPAKGLDKLSADEILLRRSPSLATDRETDSN
jgi:hypothetical protein